MADSLLNNSSSAQPLFVLCVELPFFFLCVFLNVRCQCLRRLGRTAPESFVISLFLCLSTLFASLYFSFFLMGGGGQKEFGSDLQQKQMLGLALVGQVLAIEIAFFFPPFLLSVFFCFPLFLCCVEKNRLLAFLVPVKSRDAVL